MMVLLKNESSFSGGGNHRWWGHSNPTTVLKNSKFMHSQVVGTQKLQAIAPTASTHHEPPGETFTT